MTNAAIQEALRINIEERANASEPRRQFRLSFQVVMIAVYAVLLGIVNLRHEIGYEEGQAWLIAFDSNSIADLFHNLRYEGHPSLWYLLLYLPAHLSGNPAIMQAINYVLALVGTCLVLTSRLSRSIRLLVVFSYFNFYGYGVLARSYMLTILLLTAATLCLLRQRRRPGIAILLLALACNTHFFAIPVAALIFGFLYCFPERGSWRRPATILSQKHFWAATTVLAVSLAAAYFTIRPPADSFTPQYGTEKLSAASHFLISLGSVWQAFVPMRSAYLPNWLAGQLLPTTTQPKFLAIAVSLVICLLLMAALRSARARCFFFCCTVFEVLAFSFTVSNPRMHHLGLIFWSLILALMIDAHADTPHYDKSPVPSWLGQMTLYVSLTLVMLAGVWSFAADLRRPFSEGKETAQWLKQSGYAAYPLVFQWDLISTSPLAYLPGTKAYHPECHCVESFVLFNTSRTDRHMVTSDELDSVPNPAHKPVVVVLTFQPDANTLDKLGLHLVRAFDNHPMSEQSFFVYLRQL